MDTERRESIGCLVSTVIIVALIIIGLFYFTRRFTVILATASIFILPFLPFYYLYKRHQYEENLEIEYEIQRRVEEYIEKLKDLASDMKNYNPEEYEESPMEYLNSIKEEINSIADRLKDFYDSLENRSAFYQEIQRDKIWYKKSKREYDKMVEEGKKNGS